MTIKYPKTLLAPVGLFLKAQLKYLKNTKKEVDESDPFNFPDRVTDNAIDTDAEESFGHVRSVAIKDELDEKIKQTREALIRIKAGNYGICQSCENMIDTDRLMIYPETTYCIKCAKKRVS